MEVFSPDRESVSPSRELIRTNITIHMSDLAFGNRASHNTVGRDADARGKLPWPIYPSAHALWP